MSVVANVAINLDARGANQQLRQFQQHSATAGRAAKQLQHGAAAAAWQFQQQRESTTRLAKQLRELKTEYERLTASAKASARAGGEGFGAETVDRLRVLSSQIKNTREEFHSSKAAAASYRKELNAVAQSVNQLARAEDGAARRAAKLRGIQQLAVERNPLVVAGRRRTEFGSVPQAAPGPGGVFIAPPGRSTPYRPGTQYDRPIGPQPLSQEIKDANEQRKKEIRDRIANLKAINAEAAALKEKAAIDRSISKGRERLTAAQGTSEYRDAIRQLTEVSSRSNQTINSLNEQRNAWAALRNIVDPSSKAFANASQKIKDLDERLEKLSLTQRKVQQQPQGGFNAGRLAQTAGAALSGAVFGGPEGFLGGVVGGIAGGPGGALAGAAAGAQVAMLRQAAGGAAEYAAAINQQRRALSGVVADSAAYQQSLAFINQTSRQLAIPQEQVTRNFTRLSASVLGAGGDVAAAQEAFMGISAGIRGTGGSLADLDAALLATAQVFGKGKVSAEELRGQIGERLPGAFTLFAESIGKTPQQLDKMLEKGEVGLNDFMTFVRRLSSEYGANADNLAKSSEAAGDRLTTAFGRIQEAIGKAFQPVGAEFQEALARFVTENEQALVGLAQSLAGVGKGFLDFVVTAGPALIELGKFALAFGAATLAIKAFTAAGPYVVAALRLMGVQFVTTSAAVDVAQKRLIAFGGTVKTLAASLAVPIVLTVAIVGAGVVLDWLGKIKNARDRLREAQSDIRGEAWVQSIGGQAQSIEQLQRQVQAAGNTYEYLADKIKKAREEMASTPFKPRKEFLAQQIAADEAQLAVAQSRYSAGITALGQKQASARTATKFEFPTPTPEDGGAKEKKGPKPPEDRTMELRDQLKLLIAVGEWEDRIRDLRFQGRERLALDAELSKELAQIENERVRSLQDANYEGERAHINAIAQAKQVAARRQSEDAIRELLSQRFQQELQNTQAVRDAAKPIEDLRKAQEQQLNDAKQYMRLVSEGMLPAEAQRIMNFEQTVKQQQESLDLQIAITEAAITEAEAKSLGSAELRKELTLLQRKRKAVDAAAAQGPGPGQTNAGRIEDALAAAQGELNELTAISNMAITSANAIGNAFGQAFKSIASGSASTKEVLADFFQSVSNAFLDMAAQIIAKQITMLILQTALKALGATGGIGAPGGEAFGVSPEGGGLWGGMSLGEMPALGTFAKGGVFTPDGPLHAFAKGGVITAPTEFAFADGGTMRRGLMAEAEAEAIMPLKRTADGRLGVEATIPFQRSADDTTEPTIPFQRSADGSPSRSNPFAALSAASIPFTKSTERLMVERSDRETIAAINNPKPLEVRFESQVINGVEYVTAEQHRKGMAEAADRGRKLTLAELRNSVKTRKMMGLS